MIGILCCHSEKKIAQEFFEFFKTPWEFFIEGQNYEVVISTLVETPVVDAKLVILYSSEPTRFDALKEVVVDPIVSGHLGHRIGNGIPIFGKLASFRGAGKPLIYTQSNSETIAVGFSAPQGEILRIGYDLFDEIAFLLSEGQPPDDALIPTLELHISLLRGWIVTAGISLVEIPPVPWGHNFIACLTHDVDFGGIRQHTFDHTMWGFVYRAVVGSFLGFLKGTCPLTRLTRNWIAAFSLPLVYMGIIKDFWDDLERYAEIERDFRSTFFFIPFKGIAGENVLGEFPDRRAARYDISDVRRQIENLENQGFEIGLHGIDAWHNVDKGRQESNRIIEVTRQDHLGVRIHWLYFADYSPAVLDQAGFDYDSTCGYNEAVGYRAGTSQVFRPLGVTHLLELPLHIQDTALFYPRRLALTDTAAWNLCEDILGSASRFGGVVTILWHQRSLAPERLWDEFYIRLLQELRVRGAWFGTARQVIRWFRQRRAVEFEDCRLSGNTLRLQLKYDCLESETRMFFRAYKPNLTGSNSGKSYVDIPWNGEPVVEIPLD